jgi:cytochrome c
MRVLVSLLVLAICGSVARADDIAAGQKLVEANCSRCHAIGMTGESPLAKAPPFREVVTRYPPESLGEALVEGIVTGHNEMPEFVFESDQAMEIIAYLESLKAR